jgi:hypothetical protein
MLLRLAARYFLRTAAICALGASFAGGCSRQGEGERCDRLKAGGDGDCDSGLVCTLCGDLQDGLTDRCCPPDGKYSDSRCQPGTSTRCSQDTVGTGGTAGAGGTAGSGGTAGTSSGGSDSASGGSSGDASTESGGTSGGGTGGTSGASGEAGEANAGTTAGG